MNGTKYQVRVDNVLSEEFQVVTGLKQGDYCLILHLRKSYRVYKGITMVLTSEKTRLVFSLGQKYGKMFDLFLRYNLN